MPSKATKTPTKKTAKVKTTAKVTKTSKVTKAKPSTVQSTAKRATVKRAPVKPTSVKRSTAKPTAVKRGSVKPTSVKRATAKPTSVKRASVKPTSVKRATVKPATVKRATVASLAQSLKSLETRLKGADTRNRNAVKALEKVVADVRASAKRGTTTQKAALTRGLNKLELRVETFLERSAAQAKADIRSELSSVTSTGANASTVESAIEAAHNRLDAMDKTQRESLARLNRHIADLATSVENRLSSESQAREAATEALDAKIETVRETVEKRVDRVEEETASALEVVGTKVAEFAAILEKRAQTSDADTAERLADLAQETQSGFSTAQSDVTARLEALEVIASAWSPTESTQANPYLPANEDDPRLDQMGEMIRSLQDELSRMHARIATVQHPNQNIGPNSTPTPQGLSSNIVPLPASIGQVQENPYAAAAQALETSTETIPQSVPTPAKGKSKDKAQKRDSHIPQEFDPTAYTARTQSPQIPSQAPQIPSQAMTAGLFAGPTGAPLMNPRLPAPIAPPPMASVGAHAAATPPPPVPALPKAALLNSEPLMPAPKPVSTYADPAYAEGDEMRAERIGSPKKRNRKAKSKTPKSAPKLPVSGRNLRVGAMAVGVAVAGLFAAKTLLGGDGLDRVETAANEIQNVAPAIGSEGFGTQNADLSPVKNSPPVPNEPQGQYAETQTPQFVDGQQGTLDAAVAAGNPIAQFQKGLAQLQSGQMEEGARLIRLSANRNQPAAQYRLAKLYETGTGVAKDPITARELIERSARGGNRIAMHDLGNYHAYGQGGLTRDMNAALEWFSKAAERGVVDSQFNVAFLREGNEGVPADAETALFWYHIAARQGDQGAPDRIAILADQLDAATQADIKARAAQFNPKPVDEAANGIFRNVAWAKPAGVTTQAKSAQILKIRDAQTLLTELGYQVGSPDGIAGAKTRDAVKSFEAVNGLPQTGEVTEELIQKLEIATGA